MGASRDSPILGSANSTQPPPQALVGSRRVSPAEVRLVTRIDGDISEKLGIRGDRDVDRLGAALLGVVVASMLSSVAALEFLPGPGLFRFCVVWLLAFTP